MSARKKGGGITMAAQKAVELTEEEYDLLRYYRMLDKEGRVVVMGCAVEERQRAAREETRERRKAIGENYIPSALRIIRGGGKDGES